MIVQTITTKPLDGYRWLRCERRRWMDMGYANVSMSGAWQTKSSPKNCQPLLHQPFPTKEVDESQEGFVYSYNAIGDNNGG